MLALDQVSLRYGKNIVVKNVSFGVRDGEMLCLLGPSGCGKTSVLRLIAGLERPHAGTISINGRTVASTGEIVPPHKRDVGLLFQDFALFPHLTVGENIRYGLAKIDRREAGNRVAELLRQIQLEQHTDKYPHMLSGGEQQRVALARALAPRPNVLLLDEPFSGLDTMLREQMSEEMALTLRELGVTSIMVTHDPEEALTLADRIVLMNDGEVIQTGTPDELFQSPSNVFSARFFGRINEIDGVVDGSTVKTDLGRFRNPALTDGSEVKVLLRPEALKISSGPDGRRPASELLVCGVQYAGNSSLIRLGLGEWPQPHTHVELRHPDTASFGLGEKVWIEFDPDEAFVFKK